MYKPNIIKYIQYIKNISSISLILFYGFECLCRINGILYKEEGLVTSFRSIILAFSKVSLLEHFFAEFGFCFGYGVKVRNHLDNETWVVLNSVTRFIDAQFSNLLYWIDYCAHLLPVYSFSIFINNLLKGCIKLLFLKSQPVYNFSNTRGKHSVCKEESSAPVVVLKLFFQG